MKAASVFALTGVMLAVTFPDSGWAQGMLGSGTPIETRVWLDRGVDPVFEQGDLARVYYRSSIDAHLLLFHISTDGVLRLLFPSGTEEARQALGGRDYRLLFPDSDEWLVDESPGIGYFFALASEVPFAFERLSQIPVAGGWNSSPEGNRIAADPYVVVDDFRRVLLPDGEDSGYAIDFAAYHVGQPYSYPRFVCYQCHVELPFEEWNPYLQTCLDVRVVIFNDPYYYPATRYQGDRVVYARPPEPGLPQFAFARRFLGEAGTPIVQSRTVARVAEPSNRFTGDAGGAVSGTELMRNVDQRGTPVSGQGVAPNTLLPDRPADPTPSASPLPTRASPPPRPAPDRPTLRRRSGSGRDPAPR